MKRFMNLGQKNRNCMLYAILAVAVVYPSGLRNAYGYDSDVRAFGPSYDFDHSCIDSAQEVQAAKIKQNISIDQKEYGPSYTWSEQLERNIPKVPSPETVHELGVRVGVGMPAVGGYSVGKNGIKLESNLGEVSIKGFNLPQILIEGFRELRKNPADLTKGQRIDFSIRMFESCLPNQNGGNLTFSPSLQLPGLPLSFQKGDYKSIRTTQDYNKSKLVGSLRRIRQDVIEQGQVSNENAAKLFCDLSMSAVG